MTTPDFLPDSSQMPRKDGKVCTVSKCGAKAHARGLCASHAYRLRVHGDVNGGRRCASPGKPRQWIKDNADYQGNDCLPWPFMRGANGYPIVRDEKGRQRVASRVMCEEAHGNPPSDQHEAAHSCGNGHLACMNQKHLRWATGAENQAERIAHGTDCQGVKNPAAKLTVNDVRRIRHLVASGFTQVEVAARYGVSQAQVWSIKERQSWRHIA